MNRAKRIHTASFFHPLPLFFCPPVCRTKKIHGPAASICIRPTAVSCKEKTRSFFPCPPNYRCIRQTENEEILCLLDLRTRHTKGREKTTTLFARSADVLGVQKTKKFFLHTQSTDVSGTQRTNNSLDYYSNPHNCTVTVQTTTSPLGK